MQLNGVPEMLPVKESTRVNVSDCIISSEAMVVDPLFNDVSEVIVDSIMVEPITI